jgi:hypothetical protein
MSPRKSVRPLFVSLAVLAACALSLSYALAGDEAKKDASGDAKQAATSDPKDQAGEFEAFLAMAKPGKEHEALARMAGEFDVDVEMVIQPGMPPQKSKGKEKSAMIMGGRYLHGDYTGEAMGRVFHGSSLMGYDNFKKKYFSAWVDDMSTGIMLGEGAASPDGKTITMSGQYDEPMTGKKRNYRWVTKVESQDKYSFEWFDSDPDGKNEYRMMHNVYTRVK